MATATLPYPNMDFTPLDVLTAAEMDHMVANTEYLKNFCNGLANGSNLSDGVIQARHVDWSGIPTVVGTTTGTNPNYALKYPDGTMVAVIKKSVTVNVTATWGSLYQANVAGTDMQYAENFVSHPAVSATVYSSRTVMCAADNGLYTTHAPNITVCRPGEAPNLDVVIDIVAIGRWKT